MILRGNQVVKMGDGSQTKLSEMGGGGSGGGGGGDVPYVIVDTTGLHLWPASGTVVPGLYQKFLTAVTEAFQKHVPVLLLHRDEGYPGQKPTPYFVNCDCTDDSVTVWFLNRCFSIDSNDRVRNIS